MTESRVRRFVRELSEGVSPREIPAELRGLARSALARSAGAESAAVDDALADLLERFVADARAGGSFGTSLLELDDRELAAALRVRIRQAAAARDPLCRERHALHAHVKRALAEPMAAGGAEPLRLTDAHGRFVYEQVRAAVSCVVEGDQEKPTARAVTSELLERYVAREVAWTDGVEAAAAEGEPRSLDAERVARCIRELVGERAARIVARVAAGRTVREISEAEGVPLPTVYRWCARAEKALAALPVASPGVDAADVRGALGILRQAA